MWFFYRFYPGLWALVLVDISGRWARLYASAFRSDPVAPILHRHDSSAFQARPPKGAFFRFFSLSSNSIDLDELPPHQLPACSLLFSKQQYSEKHPQPSKRVKVSFYKLLCKMD